MTDLTSIIENWNLKFPLDLWWRRKHGIAFLSKEHREANQYAIYAEWLEEKMIEEALQHAAAIEKRKAESEGDGWLREQTKSEEFRNNLFEMAKANLFADILNHDEVNE